MSGNKKCQAETEQDTSAEEALSFFGMFFVVVIFVLAIFYFNKVTTVEFSPFSEVVSSSYGEDLSSLNINRIYFSGDDTGTGLDVCFAGVETVCLASENLNVEAEKPLSRLFVDIEIEGVRYGRDAQRWRVLIPKKLIEQTAVTPASVQAWIVGTLEQALESLKTDDEYADWRVEQWVINSWQKGLQ